MTTKKRKKKNFRVIEPERPKPDGAPRRNGDRIIYGLNPVLEALRAGQRPIDKILILEGMREARLHEILYLARQKAVPFQNVPREKLQSYLNRGENHQGILAFAAAAGYCDPDLLLEEITSREGTLTVVLDGIEDPRNLGAILRCVECAGADGVFVPERRAAGLTETVAKAAAGAAEYVRVARVKNIPRLIERLKENNIWVIGASGGGDAAMNYTEWDWTGSSALVLGSEGRGLHRLVAEKCDVLVRIPMRGKIDSLNVSVAAGVILFEAVRQKLAAAEEKNSADPGV